MREMKDSGVAWIGEIPKEWNTARFKSEHLKSNVGEAIDKEYIENIILVKVNEALIQLLSVTLDRIISYMINVYYNPMTMMKIVSVVIDMIEYLY